MAVIAAHNGADDFAAHFRHQEKIRVMVKFTFDIHFRIVPRTQQIAALPQGNDFFKVGLAKNAYLHGIPRLLWRKNPDYGATDANSQYLRQKFVENGILMNHHALK
ncbi:hypothetical protein ESA_00817 [Cronobacter sakazakii ATCC BAA-894]|uniref:Uncharacterized protein n=1 Tax=Cronobacter sakazakii (strain ATCC BAA-894) TaxID=290339 RepID=A7MKX9_CROS8|nr:hypothetical protein ESA_00817 [Cronobacter sakazakii ATCC BAA-894]